jgi:membrane protein
VVTYDSHQLASLCTQPWQYVAFAPRNPPLSALLFLLGNHLIGWYLAATSITSVYGAAGSIVIVLLWVYYSSQVVLFGAEFTRVYARQRGAPLEPKENAVFVIRKKCA